MGGQTKGFAAVAVYGASGRTGRFVVAELKRRNLRIIAIGCSAEKLDLLDATATRVAAFDDPAALDRALAGTNGMINCAGSFLDTARPVIEAALRCGIHYLDVMAEQQAPRDAFADYADAGADGLFIPGLTDVGRVAELVAASPLPVNVMLDANSPDPDKFAQAGAARVSFGPTPYLLMMKALTNSAGQTL